MNVDNELRVWAKHLAGQGLTVLHREVPFDSAGRSAVLTPEEFDCLMKIDCFASDGPTPSSRDFLPHAFTVTQWLCCMGLSTALVEGLTDEQRETLALDLRAIGGPFSLSHAEFASKMEGFTQQVLAEVAALGDGEALPDEGEAFAFELVDVTNGEVLAEMAGGFQHPDAAAVLGLEEPVGDETDMLAQFAELKAESRAEFVLDGTLSREQLDNLFNTEGQTKGLKSRTVLSAITTALQRLPNRDAYSINDALVKASAQEN